MLGNNTKQEFLKHCGLMTDLGLTTPIGSKKKKLTEYLRQTEFDILIKQQKSNNKLAVRPVVSN